jgi:hypothetical protein
MATMQTGTQVLALKRSEVLCTEGRLYCGVPGQSGLLLSFTSTLLVGGGCFKMLPETKETIKMNTYG